MVWVVVANTNKCRIFNYRRDKHLLSLIKELEHPESKLRNQDLVTDKSGHYKSREYQRGAFQPDTNPKEHEIERFANMIAKELEQNKAKHQFESLLLISPPHMDGLIAGSLDKKLERLIIGNVSKDYVSFTENELLKYLTENWLDIVH